MEKRKIIFYEHYFRDFFSEQDEKVKKKIAQVLIWIQTLDFIPVTFMKSIKDVKGLYEIRIECGGNIYRIFCCFDKGNLVVLLNGFHKKTQKTPSDQIERAKKLMNEYFNVKRK